MDQTPNNSEEAGKIGMIKKLAGNRTIIIIFVILVVLFVWFTWKSAPYKGSIAPKKEVTARHVAQVQAPQETPKTLPHVSDTHLKKEHVSPAEGLHTEIKPDISQPGSGQPDKLHAEGRGDARENPAPHLETPQTDAVKEHGPAAPAPDIQRSPHIAPKVSQDAVPLHTAPPKPQPKGVAFVEAVIEPLDYELNKRFWGWRPNDVIRVTDNVNNFQLGVLEVTRRTAVILAERISRTGVTASFNRNLENAMNWFMIKSDAYWFPSPESKYNDGLNELRTYADKLKIGEASFYTRTDNLIPLLAAYEDLLGSCDENLVKHAEEDGSHVSTFKADDYFYYAQGVASALETILTAIETDFHETLSSRHGTELIHHAIESCRIAANLSPFIVTEGDLSGFLANHRANIAAPISHARFYVGVLIKTLST